MPTGWQSRDGEEELKWPHAHIADGCVQGPGVFPIVVKHVLMCVNQVNVHVYERGPYGSYKRISCFDAPSARATVHVLYCGGVHYDALVPN